MTTELIEAQLKKYSTLPRDLDQLHAEQWPDSANWIDADGKFLFVDNVATVGNWGKWKHTPMRKVEPGYWNFILSGGFSAEIKQLARDAKAGKFPERIL